MENVKVVAVLWMLAGVALVCLFAAKVSVELDKHAWSSVVTPSHNHHRGTYTK